MNIPKLYYLIMTEKELKHLMEALDLCLDTIEYKMSIAEFDASYAEQPFYLNELGVEYAKFEELLSKIEDAIGSREE